MIAFILRQVGRLEGAPLAGADDRELCFKPGQPREKWIKKRTSVKLKVTFNDCNNTFLFPIIQWFRMLLQIIEPTMLS